MTRSAVAPGTPPPTARGIAARVLERVADKGAYASRALDAELARAQLAPRDAGLATEIVYGALRTLPLLDARIERHAARSLARTDGHVRAVLRSAAYQLLYLDRVPAHAVVDQSVALVRNQRGAKPAGFVNAVLRKLAGERPVPSATPRPIITLPDWVQQSLQASLGPERLAHFLAARAAAPALCLRAEATPREALLEDLRRAAPEAELSIHTLSPLCLLVRRAGSPRALPGYAQGRFSVQEEGAQLVALAVGAAAGERIADVCAGHGGKTTLLARQVGATGQVCAIDQDERKLQRIPAELTRLGIDAARVRLEAIDLSVGTGGLTAEFDRVLVDAPCTGLGTLHRRPELLLRLRPGDPTRLGQVQTEILVRAASLVRPAGVLAFAVCSPTLEEGPQVASQFEARVPGFERLSQAPCQPVPRPDADGVIRIGAWLGTEAVASCPDAYQVVLWRRTG